MEENEKMDPNNEINENAETNANEYHCKAAEKLVVCGWVFMIACILIAFILLLVVIDEYSRDSSKCMMCSIGMIATFFAGYIVKSLLCGFAVIVESHYRKLN